MNDTFLDAARNLHRRAIVLDSHCDTTILLMDPSWDFSQRHDTGHVDIPRLREGGVSAVVLAVYAPGPMAPGQGPRAAREQLDALDAAITRHAGSLAPVRTSEEIRQAKAAGKIAIAIGIEGGYLIDDSLDILREYHRRGAIYMTLTHAFHTTWADSSGVHESLAPLHGGLTAFGREVVREMNRLGMMVDVSHVSDDCFWNVLETATAPVIASHSSCRAISSHRRNLTDEMMRAIAATGGVVQINFAAAFVDPTFPPIDPRVLEYWSTRGGFAASPYALHDTPLSILADHFDHAIRLVGYGHVGIGSDFDGVGALPRGMEDCSRLPHLTAELLRRGHREDDLLLVLGQNFLRVLKACQKPPLGLGRRSAVAGEDRGEGRLIAAVSPLNDSNIVKSFARRHEQLLRGCRLILASASPRRALILRDLGVIFDVSPAREEEPPVPDSHTAPEKWAEEISLMKARDVAGQVGHGLILAGDTVAAIADQIIGKPADRAHARQILETLMGTDHRVITALTLLDARTGQYKSCHDVTLVRMRTLSAEELDEYLDSGQWQGKAGAYGIQDHDDPFVESIQGSFTNVVGLPVELLDQMLDNWANRMSQALGKSVVLDELGRTGGTISS